MEKKLVFDGGLKGIQRSKPSAFTSFDAFDEARMAVLESGGLYKLRKPLPSAYNSGTAAYTSIANVADLRPRGMAYVPSVIPAIIYFYGDSCFKATPLAAITDRIRFNYNDVASIWTGKGSAIGNKYKWEMFIDGSDNEYLFCCAGSSVEYIKLADFSTGTLGGNAPTDNCTALCLNNRRLWIASGDKVYYTAVDDGLTVTNATDYLRLFEYDVVCDMKVYDNVIFVFTDKKIYYITGNSTDDFKVKVMEDTQCIIDSTFDVDSEGIYFMDKYANIRLIGSNPYYNAAAKSIVVSDNLNLYDKFVSNDLQYPSSINVARNQSKVYVNLGVSQQFNITNYTIDATQSSTTDFTQTGTWTETDNSNTTVKTANTYQGTVFSGADGYCHLVAGINSLNFDMTAEFVVASANDYLGVVAISDTGIPDGGTFVNGIRLVLNAQTGIARLQFAGDAGYELPVGVTSGNTYYCRLLCENYDSSAKTADFSVWIKTSNPGGTWGTADKTYTGVDVDFTWKLWVLNQLGAGLTGIKIQNLSYVENGIISSTLTADIYNFAYDLKTKEWSEYANYDGTTRKYPIEYMSPSKDRVLNTAQYLGCQYTEDVANYDDGQNYIGVFNQKGTTKDDSDMYILSNPFNIGTPNVKVLRKFYIDYTPSDAVVSLHMQNDTDFDDAVTSIMSVRSGWNTLPRTYRGRQFKWGVTTKEETEFQLKQIGFEFDDLGPLAF